MAYMTLMVPPYLIWNRYCMVPTYTIWFLWYPIPYMEQVSHCPPTCEVSSWLIWLLWSPHTLYGIGIVWSPHILYDSYGTPYLIWNRYLVVLPHLKCLHVLYDSYGPHTLYGIGIVWSPHILYDSYGTPYLIWNRYHVGPPTCEVSSCLIILLWSPLPYME